MKGCKRYRIKVLVTKGGDSTYLAQKRTWLFFWETLEHGSYQSFAEREIEHDIACNKKIKNSRISKKYFIRFPYYQEDL